MSNNKNLKAKNAFSMYDISGKEAAFLVEVYNNNELVASVVTGTNTSEYPILEANMGWSQLKPLRNA